MRVWSTDWFRNATDACERADTALRDLLEASRRRFADEERTHAATDAANDTADATLDTVDVVGVADASVVVDDDGTANTASVSDGAQAAETTDVPDADDVEGEGKDVGAETVEIIGGADGADASFRSEHAVREPDTSDETIDPASLESESTNRTWDIDDITTRDDATTRVISTEAATSSTDPSSREDELETSFPDATRFFDADYTAVLEALISEIVI